MLAFLAMLNVVSAAFYTQDLYYWSYIVLISFLY
jgi:hypothetical protein